MVANYRLIFKRLEKVLQVLLNHEIFKNNRALSNDKMNSAENY